MNFEILLSLQKPNKLHRISPNWYVCQCRLKIHDGPEKKNIFNNVNQRVIVRDFF